LAVEAAPEELVDQVELADREAVLPVASAAHLALAVHRAAAAKAAAVALASLVAADFPADLVADLVDRVDLAVRAAPAVKAVAVDSQVVPELVAMAAAWQAVPI
jgi:hypothetical protein